ncbi:MAG TPA: AI-2E family transporter [Elusimicrobiales bacterium]|nr:AI-2E family transporter [Elusimicrobiales bacterium]
MPETAPVKRSPREFVIPALIIFAFAYLLVLAKGAVFPFVLSAALAYVLNPVVKYLEVRGIKRAYAVTGLYLTVGVTIALAIYLLMHFLSFELQSLQQSWPNYAIRIEDAVLELNAKMVRNFPFLAGLKLTEKLGHQLEAIPQYLMALFPALTLAFVVPFITFFILLGGSAIIDYMLDHLPSKHAEIILHIASRIDASLGNYLRGILTEAFVIFLIAFVGLLMLGLNYSGFIAILIGVSSLVPYAGALVGAVVSCIVAYFQFGELLPIIKILLFFGGLRFLDDWFLQPYIMKKAVELSPAIILFALMAGWEVGGIWGVIFSIPVTCIIKEIIQIAVELQETEFRWKPKPEPTRVSIPYT